ncbi:MAG: hypothetical protein ACYSUF_00420 [Planctomycetota bacterium]|jgi:hypothetical protein
MPYQMSPALQEETVRMTVLMQLMAGDMDDMIARNRHGPRRVPRHEVDEMEARFSDVLTQATNLMERISTEQGEQRDQCS